MGKREAIFPKWNSQRFLQSVAHYFIEVFEMKIAQFSRDERSQVRFEAFNVLNKVNFRGPNGNRSNAGFGQITQTFDARQLQLGATVAELGVAPAGAPDVGAARVGREHGPDQRLAIGCSWQRRAIRQALDPAQTCARLARFLRETHEGKEAALAALRAERTEEGGLLGYLMEEVRWGARDLGLPGVRLGLEGLLRELVTGNQ